MADEKKNDEHKTTSDMQAEKESADRREPEPAPKPKAKPAQKAEPETRPNVSPSQRAADVTKPFPPTGADPVLSPGLGRARPPAKKD